MIFRQILKKFAKKYLLGILFILASINGLLFIFLIPPWMHYDEPGHFEYAWLAANSDHWPVAGEYDQTMRREVGASMLEHDFHEYSIYHLLKINEPISIITEQTGDVPLYYFLVSLPLRLVRYTDISFQLYVARFVSFCLFLITIFFCYKTCTLVFTQNHSLTWMVPLFLVFLPGFVDIMTAVNNDVAAIASFSFFIWTGAMLIKQGVSLKNILILLLSMLLCILSKSSAWLAAPLSVTVLAVSVVKRLSIKLSAVILIVGMILGIGLIFSWTESAPAYFYAIDDKFLPRVENSTITPLGSRVIVQDNQKFKWQGFYQTIPEEDLQDLSGQSATLGAWIWADKSTTIQFPRIGCEGTSKEISFNTDEITITKTPTFYAFTSELPEITQSVCWVRFFPAVDGENHISWDGIVLVKGSYSAGEPEFADSAARAGTWENQNFTNLLRNTSGERSWPVFSTFTRKIIPSNLRFSASRILTVLDFQAHRWYFEMASANIFRTFWGLFGWGHIFLIGRRPYWFFLFLTLFSVVGHLLIILRHSKKIPAKFTFFFLIATLLQFILVLFRGIGSWYGNTFTPSARYLFPALIPISILIVAGFDEAMSVFHQKVKIPLYILHILYGCALIMMMIWASVTFYTQFF